MNTYSILALIFGTISFVFWVIAAILYRRDQLIKNKSTEKTTGKVVNYSWQTTRGPVVKYWVNQKSYKKALFYSYSFYFKSPFTSPPSIG
ncbi:MAG: hypothetical protein L0I79_04405 [Atopostipes sp.]|nr:hypothetical protein [Atopostipes sp.]